MTVFAGRRVLAIDDNLEILELIGRIFKRFGAEVRTASDGKEGLR
jgi:CheY-like chemotaxis protein